MLGAVGVAIGATALDLLSGSAASASTDTEALDTVLRAGAVLAFVGAVSLLLLGSRREPQVLAGTA